MASNLNKIYKDIEIQINTSMFCSAASIAARCDWRLYLNGIYIIPAKQGGVNIIATDAHRLIFLWDKKGFSSCGEIILPKTELKELIKLSRSPKNRNEIIKIEYCKKKLIASLKNNNYEFDPIDSSAYPSIKDVVKKLPQSNLSDASTLYSSKFISDFRYILENRRPSKKNNVAIHIGSEGHFLAASKFGFYLSMPFISGLKPYKNMFDFIYDILRKADDDVLLKAIHKKKSLEGYKFLQDILNSNDAKIVKQSFYP